MESTPSSSQESAPSSENVQEPIVMRVSTEDGEVFELSHKLVKSVGLLKQMLETLHPEGTEVQDGDQMNHNHEENQEEIVPLSKICSREFKLIMEWASHHKEDILFDVEKEDDRFGEEAQMNDITAWDERFIKGLDEDSLYSLMMACNFLDVRLLLENCCKVIASRLKGKSVEQVRSLLGIETDYTPEQEARLKKENAWAEVD